MKFQEDFDGEERRPMLVSYEELEQLVRGMNLLASQYRAEQTRSVWPAMRAMYGGLASSAEALHRSLTEELGAWQEARRGAS